MTPIRVQRRRIKGWRAPLDANGLPPLYVGRGTRWGNPWAYRTESALARVPALDGAVWEWETRSKAPGLYHPYKHPGGRVTDHYVRYMTRAECSEMFERALTAPTERVHIRQGQWEPWLTVADVRTVLAGRDLMCWCPLPAPGQPDHCHGAVLLRYANPDLTGHIS